MTSLGAQRRAAVASDGSGITEVQPVDDARDLEHTLDGPLSWGEAIAAVVLFAEHLATDDGAQPAGVDELNPAHVEHNLLGSRGASLGQSRFEHGSGPYVQLAIEDEQVAAVLDARLHAQAAHAVRSWRGRSVA